MNYSISKNYYIVMMLFSLSAVNNYLWCVTYKNEKIDGVSIFYRESGNANKPAIILLHGFPTSSHLFRNLIPLLDKDFYLIAPDLPGFGNSDMPSVESFEYSFEHIAQLISKLLEKKGIKKYILYGTDYGAPVAFRIAVKNPERVLGFIIQNGNAYDEGINNDFWAPLKRYWQKKTQADENILKSLLTLKTTKSQYTTGARSGENCCPDGWNMDQFFLDRPGNAEIQLALFSDYKNNAKEYPNWQTYFKKYQPPMLIVWGQNDLIFPPVGAELYKHDLKNAEVHLLNTGHMALEEDSPAIADYIKSFFKKPVKRSMFFRKN